MLILNSLGSILARHHFRGAPMPHKATNTVCILLGTHFYTWVKSSNVDKVSCWRTKSARHWWETNLQPFNPESRVQSNISRDQGWQVCSYLFVCFIHECWLLTRPLTSITPSRADAVKGASSDEAALLEEDVEENISAELQERLSLHEPAEKMNPEEEASRSVQASYRDVRV